MKNLSETVKAPVKIIPVMYAVTVLLLFLLALAVQRFRMNQGMLSIGISIIYAGSCFLGGFLCGKVKKKKKYLWGLLMGTVYVMILTGITLGVKKEIAIGFSGILQNLFLCLGGGMLGGMIS